MKNPLPSTTFKNPFARLGLLLLSVLLLLISPAYATTRYVNAGVVGGAGNGSSWANAYATLQAALAAAQSGDQIWVAKGTYRPTTRTTDRSASFIMKEGVKIYGGFTSGQINLSDRCIDPALTILSGDIDSDSTWAGNSYHVIFNDQNSLTTAAVLDGFTVTGGSAYGSPNDVGGGMYNKVASPSLTNCSFVNNSAGYGGGGMVNSSSRPSLTNCSFLNNSAIRGGGIFNVSNSTTKLINCSFLNNAAQFGGGMFTDSPSIFTTSSLTNCSFLNNSANSGGGMYIEPNNRISLTNCSFLNNSALAGGGIYNQSISLLSLTNCVLFGNGGENSVVNYLNGYGSLTANHSLFEASEMDYTGSNNLTTTVSPFVSATSAELSPFSPAIDAGDDAANTTATDLAGNPRKVGTIDMGAYEYHGAGTRYVDIDRPNNSGDGLTWATAHKYLQTALAAVQSGEQVWVAKGTYTPTTSTTDRLASFTMKENVKIYGGFTSGQPNLTDRNTDPVTNGTVLSGDINNDNVLAGNSYHVIFNDQYGLTAAAVLDGFTVTGGNADGTFPNSVGGGMCNAVSRPSLNNCPPLNAVGIPSSPSLTNCSFLNNSANYLGGGMYNGSGSRPLLTDCSFLNNSANSNGGGMANGTLSSPSLTNCSFLNNYADVYGGGMYNDSSNPSLTNCSFLNNSARARGGRMDNSVSCSPSLTNCSFLNNSAEVGGGIHNYSSSNPSLTNCSFLNNYASNLGGGMLSNVSSRPSLTNCVLFGNGGQNTIVDVDNASPVTANHSLFEASETDYTGSNNLTTTVSPFVSTTSAELRPCSPAIDAGLSSANATTTDLASNARVFNGRIDMGAYEYQFVNIPSQRTWVGSVNSRWLVPGNWRPASVPTACDAVFINATPNNPVVGSGLSVHTGNITISGNATLTVDSGGTLNVHGSGGILGNITMFNGTLTHVGTINYL